MKSRCLFLVSALCLGSIAAAQPPPVAAFAALPAMQSPAISPDGARFAFIAQTADGALVYAAQLANNQADAIVRVNEVGRAGGHVGQQRHADLARKRNRHLALRRTKGRVVRRRTASIWPVTCGFGNWPGRARSAADCSCAAAASSVTNARPGACYGRSEEPSTR